MILVWLWYLKSSDNFHKHVKLQMHCCVESLLFYLDSYSCDRWATQSTTQTCIIFTSTQTKDPSTKTLQIIQENYVCIFYIQNSKSANQAQHVNHGSWLGVWFQRISWLSNFIKHSVVKDWTEMMLRCEHSNQHVQTPVSCKRHNSDADTMPNLTNEHLCVNDLHRVLTVFHYFSPILCSRINPTTCQFLNS